MGVRHAPRKGTQTPHGTTLGKQRSHGGAPRRRIRSYERLEQIPVPNELVAKMPDLNEIFVKIEASQKVFEKIAKISKMLK